MAGHAEREGGQGIMWSFFRKRNIAGISVLSFFTSTVLGLVVVLVPDLAEASGAMSGAIFSPYVLVELLRQFVVSAVGLLLLKRGGRLTARWIGYVHSVFYAIGASLLLLAFQYLTLGQTNWTMLTEAAVLLIGSLLGALLIKPRS